MASVIPGGPSAALSLLGGFAGIAAGAPLDPSAVADAPGPVRAAGSFLLVTLFGAGVLFRYDRLVDRSADASMARPVRSVLYGVIAYGIVAAVGGYGLSQLARLGLADTTLGTVGVAVAAAMFLAFASLGFVVVGTCVTGLGGERQPWVGVVVGAAVSAVPWLVLPVLPALVAWVAVASFGVGGRARAWIHDSRSVESGADA